MNNVIDFSVRSECAALNRGAEEYRCLLLSMDKLELIEEMVRFQEERTRVGHLTPKMIFNGRILFKALNQCAETEEMVLLTRSYLRHLEDEYLEFVRKGRK